MNVNQDTDLLKHGDDSSGDLPTGSADAQLSSEDPEPCVNPQSDRVDPAHYWSQAYCDQMRALLGTDACQRLAIFPLPEGFLLSVIVPVYNECATVPGVIDRLRDTGLPLQIILVDDGSVDGSGDVLDGFRDAADTELVRHERNRGKGAAIRSGLTVASGEVVVIQDADQEYRPADFRYLLQPLLAGDADVVYGTRYGHCDRQVSPWWHQAVNSLITGFASLAIGLKLTDVETCYKMAKRSDLMDLSDSLRENRFGIEIELTARLARKKLRFTERPIRYHHRWYDEGKKIGWKDGVSALWCIVKYGLLRR